MEAATALATRIDEPAESSGASTKSTESSERAGAPAASAHRAVSPATSTALTLSPAATPPPVDAWATLAAPPPFTLETTPFPEHPLPPPELRGQRRSPERRTPGDPEPGTVGETAWALRAAASDETERLGDRIAELAAHIHAVTYRMLVLLAEFDARGGWWNGFRSCAEWLSWRTGIAPGAAREKVRVAKALVTLPLLSEAMARGELSYSKLRALTRVATPENEADLLGFARAGTAAHVERVVRAWRRVDRWEEAEAEQVRHEARHLSVYPDDDGMVVIRGRLDPEVGAVLLRALEAAEDELYRAERREEETRAAAAANSHGDLEVDPGGARVSAETSPAPEPPRPTAGQRRADALGLLAEAALARGLKDDRKSGVRAERYQVVLHVDPDTLAADGSTARGATADPVGVSAETCRRLSCDCAVVTMLHDADGNVLNVGRKTRTIPPTIRRALDARDRGCRFPGCGLRFTSAHHLVHWADGGETSLENLALLCRFHHRLVHEERFRMELTEGGVRADGDRTTGAKGAAADGDGMGTASEGVRVRFWRPDGREVPQVPAAPALPPDPVGALEEEHATRGIEPDAWTPTPSWNGERLDLAYAVDRFWNTEQARKRDAREEEEEEAHLGLEAGSAPAHVSAET